MLCRAGACVLGLDSFPAWNAICQASEVLEMGFLSSGYGVAFPSALMSLLRTDSEVSTEDPDLVVCSCSTCLCQLGISENRYKERTTSKVPSLYSTDLVTAGLQSRVCQQLFLMTLSGNAANHRCCLAK